MKSHARTMQIAFGLILLFSWRTQPLQAQPQQTPQVVSPEVQDGKVTFRLPSPNATKVSLTASDIPNT